MTPERWTRIEQLFHQARALPAGARAAFLAETCRDDASMRQDIEVLLTDSTSDDGFLAGGLVSAAQVVPDALLATMAGRTIGGYALQSLLGAGGMDI